MSDISNMTAEQAAEWGKTLDFPTVWASIQGFGKKFDEKMAEIAENRKKTDAELVEIRRKNEADLAEFRKKNDEELAELRKKNAESSRKADEKFAELRKKNAESSRKADEKFAELAASQKETDVKFAKLSDNVGGLNRSVGELIETLIAGRLWEKFSGYPYGLKMAYRRLPLYDAGGVVVGEVDILLVDTVYAMAVEVKREAEIRDVDRHIKRLHLLRQYPPLHMKAEKLLGAIAGGFITQEVKDYAHSQGFFVLELTGDHVMLAEPPRDFRPTEW